MYEEDGACYVLTLHPFVSGRHVTMKTIDRLITHIKGFDGVWWTTIEGVTAHCEKLLAEGRLPIKESPLPEPLQATRTP